ncbi:MAG: thiol reductase thioredoxin, partial [Myxococcota bacterium]
AEAHIGTLPDTDDIGELEVFSNSMRTADQWQTLALELLDDRRFAEGVIALARSVATSCEVDVLTEALKRHALPVSKERAAEVFEQFSESPPLVIAATLVLGSWPASVLRSLAITVDQINYGHTALDLINAAILLEPDNTGFLFTRALVLMRLGLKEHAAIDIEELARAESDSAEFLRTYNDLLFPSFDFWPAREPPETYYDGLPDGPSQSLEDIQRVAQKYARRLTVIREALARLVSPTLEWFPPDVSDLAGDGEELVVGEFTVTDEDGDEVEIEFDETLDLAETELPDLLRMARYEWNALTFLCWSVGLDEVAMPETLNPPSNFGDAAGMAVQRLWRCRDRRLMNGYGAQRSGAPGFQWEGIEIDEVPAQLIQMAENQYAEMSALFRWLTDEDNRSPWQDNLRGS